MHIEKIRALFKLFVILLHIFKNHNSFKTLYYEKTNYIKPMIKMNPNGAVNLTASCKVYDTKLVRPYGLLSVVCMRPSTNHFYHTICSLYIANLYFSNFFQPLLKNSHLLDIPICFLYICDF